MLKWMHSKFEKRDFTLNVEKQKLIVKACKYYFKSRLATKKEKELLRLIVSTIEQRDDDIGML